MIDESIRKIAIIGTGLIGGSIGLALRERGYEGVIVGCARRESTIDRAVALGCIDKGFTDIVEACEGADLVVLAMPVGGFGEALVKIAQLEGGADGKGMVITDAGSTKSSVVSMANKVLGDPSCFVGSHPMAGGEESGPDAARGDLFEGRLVILTPSCETGAVALGKVEGFWRSMGMRVKHMGADEHDEAVARISHLPHAVAGLLVELADREGSLEIAASGFGDMTRIASGESGMWADIFLDNVCAVRHVLGQWSELLEKFDAMLGRDDRDELVKWLGEVKSVRDKWVGGDGDVAE